MRAVVVTPMLRVHDVIALVPAALVAQRRVDRLEAAVESDVVHPAVGDPLGDRVGRRDEIRGTDVGAGNDTAGSWAAASSP